jgi:HPt (histidine-containing phosphotransfer) domain-containing protein
MTARRMPIDIEHLSRQTAGDAALLREVLKLFCDRIPRDFQRLKSASGEERREVAHLIVGSARAVGASELAYYAAAVESGGADLNAVEAALAEAEAFAEIYLAAA